MTVWACWCQGQTWPGQGFSDLASGLVGLGEVAFKRRAGQQGEGLNSPTWEIWRASELERDLRSLCEQDKERERTGEKGRFGGHQV